LALTVHEASHGLLAYYFGDPTAKFAGRLTLNPLKHLDPLGTLVFFISAWLGSGFGWAKPVPVDYRNLRNPRRDGMFISAAGPAANLITAVLLALLFNLLISLGVFRQEFWGTASAYLVLFLYRAVFINVILAFFNLIPLPPLDGSGILAGLLSQRAAYRYQQVERYGFFIIMALIFLPGMLPGFPNLINWFVVAPAGWLTSLLLPWIR
jgi:Zn-dependent protease